MIQIRNAGIRILHNPIIKRFTNLEFILLKFKHIMMLSLQKKIPDNKENKRIRCGTKKKETKITIIF